MTDDELIEAMAKKLWERIDDEYSWEDALRSTKPIAEAQVAWTRDDARAALTALREAGYEVRRATA